VGEPSNDALQRTWPSSFNVDATMTIVGFGEGSGSSRAGHAAEREC
jgi:hypothetical protein